VTVACMTPQEIALWRSANRHLWRPASEPCADCPAAFAEEMRRKDCCNGIPRDGRLGRLPGDGRGRLGWPGSEPVLTEAELFAGYGVET
jgi:hypothetical protein